MNRAEKTHASPIDECHVVLPTAILMCRPHWRMLPRHQRGEVNTAFRYARRQVKQPLGDPDRTEAVRDYLVARRAAVNFVNGRLAHD